MSKRFTSLWVLTVAALLALPIKAQVVQRTAKSHAKSFFTGRIDSQSPRKDRDQKMKEALTPFQESPFMGNQEDEMLAKRNNLGALSFTMARRAAAAGADDIIVAPEEGVTKYYCRSGTGLAYSNGLYSEPQAGTIEIVETADGTVYIKDIISHFIRHTWVKGTRNGNTITIPGGQPVAYNTSINATLSVNWGDFNSSTSYATRASGDITFSVEGDKISLVGSSSSKIIGIFWDDDDAFQGFGDYNTVWTLNDSYIPPSKNLITLPEGVLPEDWYAVGDGSATVPSNVKVAFDGSDVYVSGIFRNFPDSWIKGSVSGSTVTFNCPQYLGLNGTIDAWAVGVDNTGLRDAFTFTYDTEAKTLSLDAGQQIVASATTDVVYALAYISQLTIYAPTELYTPPVTLDLTREGALRDFTVIDNNGDGRTWTWDERFGIYYMYHRSNTADDYLILPIHLEEAQNYHFVMTASTANDELVEKFEVLAGKSQDIDDLNITVIPVQAFASANEVEFDGSFFSEEAGTYYIAIHAVSEPDKWRLHVSKITIEQGADASTPAAVTDLTAVPFEGELGAVLNFTAPSKTIVGDDLAADGISRIDILRDDKVIGSVENPTPGQTLSYTDQADDLTIGTHKYQVVSYGAGSMGSKSEVVDVFMTAVIEVPYFVDFSTYNGFEAFHFIDNNNDECSWAWSSTDHAYYTFHPTNAADDYLVSSPIRLDAGKMYRVAINAQTSDPEFQERFEVLVGKEDAAGAFNIGVIPPTDLKSDAPEDFEGTFIADEEGLYYLAVHAISDPNAWRLKVNSLSIVNGPELNAPDAPGLEVVPNADGYQSASVNVTAPAKSIDGNVLPADNLTKIEILRDNEIISTITPEPGQLISVIDNASTGIHTYQALPYDANGKLGQKSEKVKAFIGKDQLGPVQNFKVVSTMATLVNFTWDEVKGVNGGWIDTENVVYTIYGLVVKTQNGRTFLDIDRKFTSVTGAANTAASIEYPVDEGRQDYQYFGISVKDNSTPESDPALANTYIVVGAPEQLPVQEGFAGNTLHYAWNTNGTALIGSMSSDGDGVAMVLFSSEPNQTIHLQLDKVNLNTAVNPTLLVDVKSDVIGSVRVIGSADGEPVATLATEEINAEYKTVKVPLSSIESTRYATVGIEADFVNSSYISPYYSMFGDSLAVDNIRIVDLMEHDLQAAIRARSAVRAGGVAAVTATVVNKGDSPVNGYTVVIKAGEKELFNKTVNESLAPFQSAEYTAELPTSVFDGDGEVVLSVNVVYDGDQNLDNNTAYTVISILAPMAAQPQNLTGAQDGNDIALAWDAPESNFTTTEDVEVYADADNGGLNEINHLGNIGEWTVFDGNEGKSGYGFNGITSSIGNPGSWIVFNPGNYATGTGSLADAYPAHSGDQYFVSSCVAEPQGAIEATDHWLISPELPGVAQTIELFACEFDNQYGAEKFEVLASSTDKEVESFSLVTTRGVNSKNWQRMTIDLPEGTKYFAIRHVSQDVFALLLDDISYLVATGDVAGYNVYADKQLIAAVSGQVTSFTEDAQKYSLGDHVFAVSAVYADGLESKPVAVNVTVVDPAGISLIAADGKPVDVYSLDGKLVRRQATDFSGLRGVYVIKGKAVLVK